MKEGEGLDSEKTQIQERPWVPQGTADSLKKRRLWGGVLAFLICAYLLWSSDDPDPLPGVPSPIQVQLPNPFSGTPDPMKAQKEYERGLQYYWRDTAEGYRAAVTAFHQALQEDPKHRKAYALLATSYIRLVDQSRKDESYFSILSKLIQLAQEGGEEFLEALMAETEFLILTQKQGAAEGKWLKYAQLHSNLSQEVFYYLGYLQFLKGYFAKAAKFLAQIPESASLTPQVGYLRGWIAEKLGDFVSAKKEYERVLKEQPQHARALLRKIILEKQEGKFEASELDLKFLIQHPDLLFRVDLAQVLYLYALLCRLKKDQGEALRYIKRATELDPENSDYLLEWYTLQAETSERGTFTPQARARAQLFLFLKEGEKAFQEGKIQEAQVAFLQAREADDRSPLPFLKLGALFKSLNQFENAKFNYAGAFQRDPQAVEIAVPYVQILIEQEDLEEAQKVLKALRKMPLSEARLWKLEGDLAHKQGRFLEARALYQKALSGLEVPSEVYLSYGKNLMTLRKFSEAPLFFSLALRVDPGKAEPLLLTARCLAETESLERAIQFLQEQQQQSFGKVRAEFLVGIAEFLMQKSDWLAAEALLKESMNQNGTYALAWKVLARLKTAQNPDSEKARQESLMFYQAYLDRNPLDPEGYLERYKLFSKKFQFDQAKEELLKIQEWFPKYPGLFYYFGLLYAVQKNHLKAIESLKQELQNHSSHYLSLLLLGKELLEIQKYEEALEAFSKAMKQAPQDPEPKHLSGWTHFLLKNYQSAITLLQLSQALDPGNPMVARRLAEVYRESGEGVQACRAFQKYLQLQPEASANEQASFAFCRQ